MDGFGFVHRETIRFRDLDAMGHVNNAVFLTYMESARVAFLLDHGTASSFEDLAIIVARIEIDFRAPLGFEGEVEIGVRPAASAGRASTSSTSCARATAGRGGEERLRRLRLQPGGNRADPGTWRERLAA